MQENECVRRTELCIPAARECGVFFPIHDPGRLHQSRLCKTLLDLGDAKDIWLAGENSQGSSRFTLFHLLKGLEVEWEN